MPQLMIFVNRSICYVCNRELPHHVTRDRIYPNDDGSYIERCVQCYAGTQKWMNSKHGKKSKFRKYFENNGSNMLTET